MLFFSFTINRVSHECKLTCIYPSGPNRHLNKAFEISVILEEISWDKIAYGIITPLYEIPQHHFLTNYIKDNKMRPDRIETYSLWFIALSINQLLIPGWVVAGGGGGVLFIRNIRDVRSHYEVTKKDGYSSWKARPIKNEKTTGGLLSKVIDVQIR